MKNGPVLKMDKFCPTGPDREGGGGSWLGSKKNKGGGRAEIKKMNFRIKNWIFLIYQGLEICTRRFRRNFDMRIFPKFF
jgi:hypothetical protein